MRVRILAVFALLVAAIAGAPAIAAAASPLAGQWPLDAVHPGGGLDLTDDTSGSSEALTAPSGTVKIDAAGKFGGAISATNHTVLHTVGAGPAPARLTLLAWIKQSGDPGVLKYVAGRGDDGPSTCLGSSYAIYSGYNGMSGLRFYVRTTTSSVLSDAPTTQQVFDGNWHLVAGTFDGSALRFYVDGTQIGATKTTTEPVNYALGGGNTMYADGYPQSGCGNADWPGPIDDVRVYDRALSATEIGRLAAATGPASPVLVPDATPPTPTPIATPTPTATPAAQPSSPPTENPQPTPAPVIGPLPVPTALVPVIAAIPASGSLPGTATFDASGSTGAASFAWDLGGDGVPDVTCPGSQPVVSVSTATSAARAVSLAVTSAAGATSRVSSSTILGSTLRVSTGRQSLFSTLIPKALRKYTPPDVATCSQTKLPSGAIAGGVGALSPILSALCTQQTVIWSLASASGCFSRVADAQSVPAPERALISAHYDSYEYSPTVVVLCKRAQADPSQQKTCDQAKSFFTVPYDVYVSKQTVDLNGISITPKSGASVVMFPKLGRIVTSNATMKWGKFTVRTGALDFNFSNDPAESGIKFTGSTQQSCACGRSSAIARYDGEKDIPDIAGFKINGSVDLALEGINGNRYSSGVVQLTLPPDFGVFGSNPPSANTKLLAQNGTGGPVLDSLNVSVPQANLGPLRLANVQFQYAARGHINGDTDPNSNCNQNEWRAQADVFLAGGKSGEAGFKLSPPPSQNGIGFCNGGFRHAGGALIFGGPIPKPVLFPGVELSNINFALQLHPFLARGGVGIDVAKAAHVDGALLMALATPQEPYTLTPQDAGGEFATLAGRKFTSTTIMGGGDVSINFPEVGMIPVGSAAMMYSYPDHIAAFGQVNIVVPGFSIEGHAGIEALFLSKQFTANIGGTACLAGVRKGLCIGADGWVTSKGIVACLNILNTFHPGAGLNWATRKVEIWPIDGCKPSHYWVTFNASRAATAQRLEASDLQTFRVRKGQDVVNVKLAGTGAPPKVKVTAPGGETLTIDGDDWVSSAHMAGVRFTDNNAVYIGVKGGAPGTYTVEAVGDSSALGTMAVTRPDTASDVTGSVSASASAATVRLASAARLATVAPRRTFQYKAGAKGGGQTVTFAEQDASGQVLQQIATVHGGSGKLRFTPAVGAAGKRQIVASLSVDGTPAAPQVVATYTVGTPRKLSAPSKVSLRRSGKNLVATWSPVVGADRYGLLVRLVTGEQRQIIAKAGQRRVTIKDVATYDSATVKVTPHGGLLAAWGGGRTSNRVKATAPVPTVLQTKARNQKKGNL